MKHNLKQQPRPGRGRLPIRPSARVGSALAVVAFVVANWALAAPSAHAATTCTAVPGFGGWLCAAAESSYADKGAGAILADTNGSGTGAEVDKHCASTVPGDQSEIYVVAALLGSVYRTAIPTSLDC